MRIILIGFMGAGKSSVAKALEKKLGINMIEMDDLVVKKSGRRMVKEIFSKDGEIRFRELEIQTAKELMKKEGIVISTGGGVVMNKIIIDFLKEKGRVIFLKASFETIKKRLVNDKERPLFQNRKNARKLFNFRQKLYEEYSDLTVDTDNKTVDEVVKNLTNLL